MKHQAPPSFQVPHGLNPVSGPCVFPQGHGPRDVGPNNNNDTFQHDGGNP